MAKDSFMPNAAGAAAVTLLTTIAARLLSAGSVAAADLLASLLAVLGATDDAADKAGGETTIKGSLRGAVQLLGDIITAVGNVATEASLASLDGKVMTCDTSPLALESGGNLATIAAIVDGANFPDCSVAIASSKALVATTNVESDQLAIGRYELWASVDFHFTQGATSATAADAEDPLVIAGERAGLTVDNTTTKGFLQIYPLGAGRYWIRGPL